MAGIRDTSLELPSADAHLPFHFSLFPLPIHYLPSTYLILQCKRPVMAPKYSGAMSPVDE
eukprot:1896733-Rhodomonas_salina.1